MEWRFGVTAATSEMTEAGQSYLHLKLKVDKGGGQVDDVLMEVSLPQFYALMHEMEKAKAAFQMLSWEWFLSHCLLFAYACVGEVYENQLISLEIIDSHQLCGQMIKIDWFF